MSVQIIVLDFLLWYDCFDKPMLCKSCKAISRAQIIGGMKKMDYKKLVSLLAVSSFALAACAADEEPSPDPDIEEGVDGADEVEDTEDTTDETEDAAEDTEEDGEGQSAHDIIDGIGSDLNYTSSIELEVTGGTWSQDGYVFTPEDGEATVNGSAASGEDVEEVFAFVIQEGEVIEKPTVEEGAFTFTVSATDADQEFEVGVSDEDLWEVGDEANVEDLVRYEDIIVLAPQ